MLANFNKRYFHGFLSDSILFKCSLLFSCSCSGLSFPCCFLYKSFLWLLIFFSLLLIQTLVMVIVSTSNIIFRSFVAFASTISCCVFSLLSRFAIIYISIDLWFSLLLIFPLLSLAVSWSYFFFLLFHFVSFFPRQLNE